MIFYGEERRFKRAAARRARWRRLGPIVLEVASVTFKND